MAFSESRKHSLSSRFQLPGWWMSLILAGIIVAGCLPRFFKLGHESLNFDELASVWTSKLPLNRIIPEAVAAGHPPAFNLITHFWPMPAGNEFFSRTPSALLGVLIIALVYITGKELLNRAAGLWAAAITAASPLMIWYSRDATYYCWLMAVSLLSLYFLIISSRRGGWMRWSLYSFATLLVVGSYFLAFILIIAGMAAFWLLRDPRLGQMQQWAVSHAILAAAVVALFFMTRSATGGRSGLSMPSLQQIMKDIINWPVVFVQGYADQAIGSGVLGPMVSHREIIIACMCAAFIAILIFLRTVRKKRFFSRDVSALLIYAAILVIGPVVVQLAAPGSVFASRYYVWAAPAFALTLSFILAKLPLKIALFSGVILLALMTFYTVDEIKVRRNENWRDIMAIIATQSQPVAGILCFPEMHCSVAAAFYLPSSIPLYGGNISGDGVTNMYLKPWSGFTNVLPTPFPGGGLDAEIRQDLAGAGQVWMVTGDGALGNYPPTPQAKEILEKYWKEGGKWDFPPLELFRYQASSAGN